MLSFKKAQDKLKSASRNLKFLQISNEFIGRQWMFVMQERRVCDL